MPTAFGAEFRQDVVDVARKGEAPMAQIAKDFVSPVIDAGSRPLHEAGNGGKTNGLVVTF